VRVAVLGAGGTIAPAIVRDLAESEEFESILCLDIARERAREVANVHGGDKADAAAVDAGDPVAMEFALDGQGLLINSGAYRFNAGVMDACLAQGVGYIDLGGLYHVAERQYAHHDRWEERGMLAVLGCGAGPGKTNLMAAAAARRLDAVGTVRCASAGHDEDPPDGFSTPYAVRTLVDELTLEPMVVRDGEPQAIEPLTDGGTIRFPDPIGERPSLYTLHSEVLTLPRTLGAPNSDFRLALSPRVLEGLKEIIAAGTADEVRPEPPSPRTYSGQVVEATGTRDGRALRITATALTVPHERWGLGGGVVSTGTTAAAVARLYARGRLATAGVLAPEQVLDPDELFAELEPRGCTIDIHESEVRDP